MVDYSRLSTNLISVTLLLLQASEDFEPQLRRRVISYLNNTTYDRFEHIASRFTASMQMLANETATSHPDVMPVSLD